MQKSGPKQISKKKTEITLCKFYKNGRCNKSKKDCKFDHPKICHKFNQFGPKNGINKGCDETCGFFHPNACRNSVKDRTCSYSACRFYHLKDTKLINKSASNKYTTKQNTSTQSPRTFKKHKNYKPKFSKKVPMTQNKTEIKNKYQVLETETEADSEEESSQTKTLPQPKK